VHGTGKDRPQETQNTKKVSLNTETAYRNGDNNTPTIHQRNNHNLDNVFAEEPVSRSPHSSLQGAWHLTVGIGKQGDVANVSSKQGPHHLLD
jgi:hypothetical protein